MYIDIKLSDMHIKQRSEFSKLIIESNNTKLTYSSLDMLPEELQKKIKDIILQQKYPDRYFKYFISDGELEITGLDNAALLDDNIEHIYIPSKIDGYTTTAIRDIFRENKNILSLYLPDTIKELKENMCSECDFLIEVHIPTQVTKIPSNCFRNCKELEKINLENIKIIENSGFSNNYALNNINLDNLEKVNNYGFLWCVSLEKVNAPKLTYIGNDSFSNCKFLEEIKYSDKLSYLGRHAFYDCYHLKGIILPETLKEINESAFEHCEQITEIEFQKGLEYIGKRAFSYCNIENVITLPNTSLYIGERAFHGCNIKRINISKNTKCEIDAFSYEQLLNTKTYDTIGEKIKGIFSR